MSKSTATVSTAEQVRTQNFQQCVQSGGQWPSTGLNILTCVMTPMTKIFANRIDALTNADRLKPWPPAGTS